jgi:predicted Zn-dependent peptidase
MHPLLLGSTLLLAAIQVGPHTFHQRTLENGLQALAVDDGEEGSISVFVVYAVGTRAETPETLGLAHLVEHSLFTGTAATPAGEHDATIQVLGGESNAYTRADYTAYYAHRIPPGELKRVLALEADRMRGLTWEEAPFLHERERLRVEELHSHESPVRIAAQRGFAVWEGRGYGPGLLDEAGNTRGPTITLETAKAFYDAWYHPRQTAVVVVGGDPEAALDAVEAAFGGLPAGPEPPAPPAPPSAEAREIELEAPIARDRLEWAWVGPSRAEPEERLALVLLTQLFSERGVEEATVETWMGGGAGEDLFVIAATGEEAAAQVEARYQALRSGDWKEEELSRARLFRSA